MRDIEEQTVVVGTRIAWFGGALLAITMLFRALSPEPSAAQTMIETTPAVVLDSAAR